MLHTQSADQVQPNPKPARGVVEELAEAMIDLNADGGATEDRLRERGFSKLELDMYGTEARQLASQSFVRRVDTHAYDRAMRITQAAGAIGHLMPSVQEICTALQSRSFTKFELDDILPEAVATAADMFAHQAGAQ